MIHRLRNGFNLSDESEVEDLLKKNNNMATIAQFFTSAGPRKIIVHYQVRPPVSVIPDPFEETSLRQESSLVEPSELPYEELFITDGEAERITARAIYFLKTHAGDTIDPSVENETDHALSFGMLDASELKDRAIYLKSCKIN